MRVYNFSAGPAALPEPVLQQAAAEMLDWRGSGMSVMEMSHRGPEFMSIAAEATQLLRELLNVPANYHVLFMQGGGLAENAIVPMNLLRGKTSADFIHTGEWSGKSIAEARKYCEVHVAASAADRGFTYAPKQATWQLSRDPAYVHVCTNETIGGVEFNWVPKIGNVPLVVDMSSHILSRVIDVNDYALIYGGAQKNIGPAGLTIVLVRDDLLHESAGKPHPALPSAFDYRIVAKNESMYNTPPTYAWYIAGLVFNWLKRQGGVAGMEARNIAKAKLLYDALDASTLYENRVDKEDRSRMNVTFFLKDESLNAAFLKGAAERGLAQLRGHRAVGGMRASIYNAMPLEGVQALVDYLRDFERKA